MRRAFRKPSICGSGGWPRCLLRPPSCWCLRLGLRLPIRFGGVGSRAGDRHRGSGDGLVPVRALSPRHRDGEEAGTDLQPRQPPLVSCDGCHSRMPHENGGTDSVPMEVCFACHGVKHGPQGELATSDCRKCHTPSFDLVPATISRRRAFGGKPHAELARARRRQPLHDVPHGQRRTATPATPRRSVKIAPLPDAYVSVVVQRPKSADDQDLSDRADQHGAVLSTAIRTWTTSFRATDLRARDSPAARLQVRDVPSQVRPHVERPGEAGHAVLLSLPRAAAPGPRHDRHRGVQQVSPAGVQADPGQPHRRSSSPVTTRRERAADPAYCAMCHKTDSVSSATRAGARARTRPGQAGRSSIPPQERLAGAPRQAVPRQEGRLRRMSRRRVVPRVPQDDDAAPAQLDSEPQARARCEHRRTATSATPTGRRVRTATTRRSRPPNLSRPTASDAIPR